MSFPRYPKYKHSGVEWLGQVPEHWEVRRLKHCARLITEKAEQRSNPVALENIEGWTGRLLPSEGEYQGEGTAFAGGDILFGKLRPYLAKVHLATQPGEAVGDFHVLRPGGGLNGYFAQYQMLTREFIDIVDGSTYGSKMPRASWEFVGDMPLAVPPPAEQPSIATFLDRETAKIDNLIAEQQRLIELLQEKRQAVISHAVTKGLNPDAPMKHSGIEWLGEVPEHWNITRINFVADGFIYGTSVDCNSSDSGTPVLRIPNIKEGFVDFTDLKFASLPPEEEQRYVLRHNDILVVRTNGNPALVGKSAIYAHDGRMLFASYLIKITPRPCVVPEFLNIAMNAACTREMLTLSARTSAGNYNMNCAGLGKTPIALPPITEQNEILERLSVRLSEQESLLTEATRAISLLQERRSALISAAVTGQIDVQGLTSSEAA